MRRVARLAAPLTVLWAGLGLSAKVSAEDTSLAMRARLGAWSGDRGLSDNGFTAAGNLWLSAYQPLTEGVDSRVETWLYNVRRAGQLDPVARLREAVLRLDGPSTRVSLGWQIFAWGRADRFNPTDNLSARDARALVGSDDEQRFASPALSMRWQNGAGGELTALAKRFEPTVTPSQDEDERIPLRRGRHPQAEFALRCDRSGEAFDWSVSWVDGFEKVRSFAFDPSTFSVFREYRRLRAFGGDFVRTLGPWTVRGEAALLQLSGLGDTAFGARRPQRAAVLALERSLDDAATASVQWFTRRVSGGAPLPASEPLLRANGQWFTEQNGLSLRYAKRLAHDTLDYELVAITTWPNRSWALRPRLNYQLSDSMRLGSGLDLFRGTRSTIYGDLRRNSVGFVELSVALP
jgi:hypothetical protein